MIKSMTGYGRAQNVIDGRDITVGIKSVNHRSFEFSARTPRIYGYLDEKIKKFLQGKIARGKVEVSVQIINPEAQGTNVEINYALAESYAKALREMADRLNIKDDLSISVMTRFSGLFTVQKEHEDEDAVWNAVESVLNEALEKFVKMRTDEGEKMREDVLSRLIFIEESVTKVESLSEQTVSAYREKLYNKIKEVLSDKTIDEQRILTEAAIFSEKIAVDEETVRLKSHINQFRSIVQSSEPVGRKLDFLVQEINRETNTIGSKASDLSITKLVVDMKSEIEKIREQIQNIE